MEKRGRHPNSLKNLKPAKPGEVRNPEGSKKGSWQRGKLLTHAVREALDEIVELTDKDGNLVLDEKKKPILINRGVQLVKRIVIEAIGKGDIQMIKTVWNYLDGMPPEFVDITTDGSPITKDIDEIIKKAYGKGSVGTTSADSGK